jgi:predicted DNA binding CopG/RHH family protein
MQGSRILSSSERRRLLGPEKSKQISLRRPEEDLEAVKEIAEANARPYQQFVVVAVQ